MAWLYVPVGEALKLPSNLHSETVINASCTSREKYLRPQRWSSIWKKGGWIRRLSGMTLNPSEAMSLVRSWATSTFYRAESRASPTVSRANSAERTTSETSGRTPQESSPTSSPVESFLRTSLASLHLTELECAYTAGLIDGEGWIGIQQSKNYYGIAVDVGMAEKAKPLLDEMATKFGGKVTKFRNQTDKWATAYRWRTFGATAATLLLAIRPYLSLKPQQADIALELQLQLAIPPHNTKWTPALRKQAANWKNQIHQLNQRGPHVPTVEDAWTALREDNHITLNESGQTYEQWVTQLRRDYSRRLRSAQAINASDSSYWATATANRGTYSSGDWSNNLIEESKMWPTATADNTSSRSKRYAQGGEPLTMATGMWRTPSSSDGEGGVIQPQEGKDMTAMIHYKLRDDAAMWPTPTSSVAGEALNDEMDIYTLSSGNLRKRAKSGQTGSIGLPRVAMFWPTPTQRDHKDGTSADTVEENGLLVRAAPRSSLHSETTQKDGQTCSPRCRKLNPLFVELHMGVPMGFSSMKTGSIDSDRWETWLSHSRERLHLLISHTRPDCMMGVSDED